VNDVFTSIRPPVGIATLRWLRGRAIAALVCAGFGAGDMLGGMKFVSDGRQIWLAMIVVLAGALVIAAVVQVVRLGRLPKPATDESAARRHLIYFGSRFAAIVALEVILINLGPRILVHFHRLDLMPQWVEAIVGLHFFPLARLFRVNVFYVTGAGLLVAALGSLALPAGHGSAAVAVMGSGLCLWVTAVALLKADSIYVRVAGS
jgi:hypothetical protein